ncbi:hypothetical protein [Legionella shakespearei]|uniref:Uncharacterized protein n=1 Tax=Legionella shakespearei DSM 23087 TaxID=1122169 RepID=A0A0W0YZS9_9GAMM|nr:hypothetical protein [Legionella shakespearei]KTD62363.1 hypothetical protein Lsha_1063 [Legionella shakespearei DSM 23087]
MRFTHDELLSQIEAYMGKNCPKEEIIERFKKDLETFGALKGVYGVYNNPLTAGALIAYEMAEYVVKHFDELEIDLLHRNILSPDKEMLMTIIFAYAGENNTRDVVIKRLEQELPLLGMIAGVVGNNQASGHAAKEYYMVRYAINHFDDLQDDLVAKGIMTPSASSTMSKW